jgi:urease accessory protein UreF
MSNPRERLTQLRREIEAFRRQIAALDPADSRRETLYLALLQRYHQSLALYSRLFNDRPR